MPTKILLAKAAGRSVLAQALIDKSTRDDALSKVRDEIFDDWKFSYMGLEAKIQGIKNNPTFMFDQYAKDQQGLSNEDLKEGATAFAKTFFGDQFKLNGPPGRIGSGGKAAFLAIASKHSKVLEQGLKAKEYWDLFKEVRDANPVTLPTTFINKVFELSTLFVQAIGNLATLPQDISILGFQDMKNGEIKVIRTAKVVLRGTLNTDESRDAEFIIGKAGFREASGHYIDGEAGQIKTGFTYGQLFDFLQTAREIMAHAQFIKEESTFKAVGPQMGQLGTVPIPHPGH